MIPARPVSLFPEDAFQSRHRGRLPDPLWGLSYKAQVLLVPRFISHEGSWFERLKPNIPQET